MEKINIAEILKDCPKGMELDCTMFDDVKFIKIEDDDKPICIRTGDIYRYLTKFGTWTFDENAKCVIFPKGKTTWEGFVPPCKFKDGDIVTCTNDACTYTAIFKEMIDKGAFCHYGVLVDNKFRCRVNDWSDFNETCRLATEEEKEQLFQSIKDNGYKWNSKTKTLEKLIEPKFKVGDKVKKNKDYISGIVTDIFDDSFKVTYDGGGCSYVQFHYQDDWELVPNIKPKFKVGDVIRRKGDYISGVVAEIYNDYECKVKYKEGAVSYVSIKAQDEYELVHSKFDITTLKPFKSEVLMRSSNTREWVGTIYSHYNNNKFYGCGMCCDQCIPYKGNEHLLGKTDDCDEYFKNW